MKGSELKKLIIGLLFFGGDAAVWLDGFEGTRTLTTDAIKGMSGFVRRFSWE